MRGFRRYMMLLVLMLVVMPEIWAAVFPRFAPIGVLRGGAARRLMSLRGVLSLFVSLFVPRAVIGTRARA
jgi:hypothetical protein